MSGRAPARWILLVVVLAAAAWFFLPREDGGGRSRDGRTEGDSASGSGGAATGSPLDAVLAELLNLPQEDNYRGQLQISIDPSRAPGGGPALDDVYEVEMRFEDMDPPLAFVESTGLLHPGWNERELVGAYRFFTLDAPLTADGRPARWQFGFDTSAASGRGPKLVAGRVRLYDRDGDLMGVKDLVLK